MASGALADAEHVHSQCTRTTFASSHVYGPSLFLTRCQKSLDSLDSLYVPSYQSYLGSLAILEEQGAFHRLESQEIVRNGKHLCCVIHQGKHYILEEAATPEIALAL
jgi:hypothetical protein